MRATWESLSVDTDGFLFDLLAFPDEDDLLLGGAALHRLRPDGQVSSEPMEGPRVDGVLHRICAAGPYLFAAGGRGRIFRRGPGLLYRG